MKKAGSWSKLSVLVLAPGAVARNSKEIKAVPCFSELFLASSQGFAGFGEENVPKIFFYTANANCRDGYAPEIFSNFRKW